jgi:outer membrane protein
MKKSLIVLGLALTLFSCNNSTSPAASGFKTAYVDTQKLMEKSDEIKDLDDKRKVKTEEMGRELDAEVQKQQRAAMGAAESTRASKERAAAWY